MDDKVYVLYVDLNKVDIEDAKTALDDLRKALPNKTCICLPKEFTLTEMDRSQTIKDLQKTIDYLSQE